MIYYFKEGTSLFVYEAKHSIPLSASLLIVALAFVLALLVATGVRT